MYVSPQIVVGFHGCDSSTAAKVINTGQHLSKSSNNYDWLGHGIYFWEGSYERALEWASNKKVKNPSVIGAFIKLGNYLDLLDSKYVNKLTIAYNVLETEFSIANKTLPQNQAISHGISFNRRLDCQVILRLHQLNDEAIAKELNLSNIQDPNNKIEIQRHPNHIDSVRGLFPEGKEAYSGAGFRIKNHIQLCILNPNCIVGYFHPIQANSNYKEV